MNILTVFVLFFSGYLVGCKEPSVLSTHALEGYFRSLELKNDTIFIIPGSGCLGCILYAQELVVENIKNSDKEITFILTRVDDFKIMKRHLGITDKSKARNIIYDKQNRLGQLGYRSIYPLIVTLCHGKIVKIEFLTPES